MFTSVYIIGPFHPERTIFLFVRNSTAAQKTIDVAHNCSPMGNPQRYLYQMTKWLLFPALFILFIFIFFSKRVHSIQFNIWSVSEWFDTQWLHEAWIAFQCVRVNFLFNLSTIVRNFICKKSGFSCQPQAHQFFFVPEVLFDLTIAIIFTQCLHIHTQKKDLFIHMQITRNFILRSLFLLHASTLFKPNIRFYISRATLFSVISSVFNLAFLI